MSVHLLGIRHHGPGSAKNIKAALEEIRPDIILVEGPPEGEALLKYVIHPDMKPPVALLAYQTDVPSKAVFYPFTVFSPEWQALVYGVYNNLPIRFFDLPLIHKFALDDKNTDTADEVQNAALAEDTPFLPKKSPLQRIAEVAGFSDHDTWWEQTFEQRNTTSLLYFQAIQEVMVELRSTVENPKDKEEALREAFMRTNLRKSQKDGYQRIVIVCGAWHVPALMNLPAQKDDDVLIKKLPKAKVESTWIPWTNSRLSFQSGYGAGINSPGWYEYLWEKNDEEGIAWLIQVAQLFRSEKIDISPAHIIETQRLAHTLTALRNKTQIGLDEMNEACRTVLCMGDDAPMRLIWRQLIVGDKIGETPSAVPKVPLLADVEMTMKKLRLKPEATKKEIELDLREENDLAKSKFLHRLNILGIAWASAQEVRGKGTFKEGWVLEWSPEVPLKVIENAIWGNTTEKAATHFLKDKILNTNELAFLSKLLQHAIPADLPGIVSGLTAKISDLAADTSDISELMDAFNPLAYITRYGNVRKTDASLLLKITDGLITRISIGLPIACSSVDEDSAGKMCNRIVAVQQSVALLDDKNYLQQWQEALQKLVDLPHINPLIAGTACRLLRDAKVMTMEAIALRMSQRLSIGEDPNVSAQWLEGFLKDSAMVLILEDAIFKIIDEWVQHIDLECFTSILPLLRRTFSSYAPSEKHKIGEKAKHGTSTILKGKMYYSDYDEEKASAAMALLEQILY
jgi:Family of unknown function (DUF5682)